MERKKGEAGGDGNEEEDEEGERGGDEDEEGEGEGIDRDFGVPGGTGGAFLASSGAGEVHPNRMQTHASSIELLEARIALALIASVHSVIHFIDVDGDKVTITASHGKFSADVEASGQLDLLHLNDPSVNHANITIRVVKVSSGNGLVNIPRIDGGTNNFGTVTIQGDLGEIDCGSDAAGAVALVKLSVNSIGADTALYQTLSGTISGDGVSRIQGALVSLTVTHDVDTSYIRVGDGANLGSVTIGGSLIGSSTGDTGEIYAEGNLGTAVIKKNIVGGTNTMTYANNYSGAIGAGHEIHSVTVGGSVIGGTGQYSGYIYSGYLATGNLDKVSIGGNIDGTEVNLYSGEVLPMARSGPPSSAAT
jgi:hypothetical protein